MANETLEHQDIVRLLARLKEQTPDYPVELAEARKYSYMKQIVDLKISLASQTGDRKSGNGTGGKKGGTGGARGPGGSGAALGGGSTVLGISMKAVLAVGVVILLTAAYIFRDQIVETLAENQLITTQESSSPLSGSAPVGQSQETKAADGLPASGLSASEAAPGPDNNALNGTPGSGDPFDHPGGAPDQGSGLKPETTATQPQGGLAGFIQYLLCILRGGGDSCS